MWLGREDTKAIGVSFKVRPLGKTSISHFIANKLVKAGTTLITNDLDKAEWAIGRIPVTNSITGHL